MACLATGAARSPGAKGGRLSRCWRCRFAVWIAPRRPAAVLFVTDPDRDGRVRIDELRQRFGLTRAETGFLGEIVKGDGLQAAADRLGVSLATARTHLRHVFDKTGTQRQADLVGLMVVGQTTLREEP
jgi:DNA-binding CsgD family transcriptional regulator